MLKIGWTNRGYPVERTILNRVQGVEYVRSHSYASCMLRAFAYVHIPKWNFFNFGLSYIGGTADRHVDLFHFFNLLGCGRCTKPYVTTFETSVPRGLKTDDYWFKRGLESITSDRCRKLLALSECAKQIQLDVLRQFLTESDLKKLEDKIMVLHPPQKVLHEGFADKAIDDKLKAVFVGRDFFRKGGGEALRAFVKLRRDYPVELWLIGDPRRMDYLCNPRIDDAHGIVKTLNENKNWIHWFSALPNEKVLELLRTCDVGLLPTRADTYGYSVLEMQACGLPVITTDVRALPEINNDGCGWVIRGCGKRDGTGVFGEADYSTPERLVDLSRRIEHGVYEKVVEAIMDRESVFRKGVASRERIRLEHAPEHYGRRLFTIYQDALS